MYRSPTSEELQSPEHQRRVLELKLSIWESRLRYKSNPDAERAVADLRAKLAAL